MFSLSLFFLRQSVFAKGSKYQGDFGGACVSKQSTNDGQLPERPCGWSLMLKYQSRTKVSQYNLTHNHPREVFRYASYDLLTNAGPVDLFYRLPILGEIRDRVINQRPLDQSLLFSFSLIGGGVFIGQKSFPFKGIRMGLDLNYFKQRYAGLILHTNELADPENEKIFGLSQLGLAGIISWDASFYLLSYEGEFRVLKPIMENEEMLDTEFYHRLSLQLSKWFKLNFSHYFRSNDFRRDQKVVHYNGFDWGGVLVF